MVLDDFFKNIPNFQSFFFDHALGALDRVNKTAFTELFDDKRLEKLEGHLFRQTALIQLQLRTDDDNRTTGIVDAFTEQVLTETALFALEHVAQALQRTIARSENRTTVTAVVKQRVNGFLKHALFIANDDFGSS